MARIELLLLAVDLDQDADYLLGRVLNLYDDLRENIHIVHVIKHGMHDAEHLQQDFSKNPYLHRLVDRIRSQLRTLFAKHDLLVADERVHIAFGEPACEIKRLAEELHAELVIVGSHTRHNDWLQLPGATTNCVIQGIKSDVMAVKVAEHNLLQADDSRSKDSQLERTSERLEIR